MIKKYILGVNKKVKYIILFLLLAVTVLVSLYIIKSKNNLKVCYNSNEWLTMKGDSFYYKKKVGEITCNSASVDYELSGIDTFWEIDVEEKKDISFQCNNMLQKGKVKLILISPTNEVKKIFEGNVEGVCAVQLEKGVSRIRFVGEKAVGKLDINIECDNTVKVKVIENHLEFDW